MVTAVTWTAVPCIRNVMRLMTPNRARKSPKMLTNCASHRVRNGRCLRIACGLRAGAVLEAVMVRTISYKPAMTTTGGRRRRDVSRPPSQAFRLLQVLSYEIQHVLPVQPEHATGAGAVPIESERRDPGDHVARGEVVRAARVTEARAAGRGVVREQQGVIPHDAAVD